MRFSFVSLPWTILIICSLCSPPAGVVQQTTTTSFMALTWPLLWLVCRKCCAGKETCRRPPSSGTGSSCRILAHSNKWPLSNSSQRGSSFSSVQVNKNFFFLVYVLPGLKCHQLSATPPKFQTSSAQNDWLSSDLKPAASFFPLPQAGQLP